MTWWCLIILLFSLWIDSKKDSIKRKEMEVNQKEQFRRLRPLTILALIMFVSLVVLDYLDIVNM